MPSEFTFFSDEDLGTRHFPEVLHDADIQLEKLLDHFPSGTPDAEWIPQVAHRGWVALTHDRRIRYNRRNRDAAMNSGARIIVISSGTARAEMARIFVELHDQILGFLRENRPPFIARLYHDRIEMWLSRDNWPT